MQVERSVVGRVIGGKYGIERVVGEGGCGVVVRAVHRGLGQPFAIKLLKPALATRDDVARRFVREAQALATLTSAHTVRAVDVGTEPGLGPYFVMEWLDGMTLAQALATGPADVATAVDYSLQICAALAEAHRAGLIHRDIKPSNLFLTRRADGRALLKVMDFGIAKWTGAGGAITAPAVVLGSPGYLAPEQAKDARSVDARADIWAIGAVLHELLSGQPLHGGAPGDTPGAHRLLGHARPLPPSVPPALRATLDRCLAPDRAARYPHVAALAADLAIFAPPAATTLAPAIARIASAPPAAGRGRADFAPTLDLVRPRPAATPSPARAARARPRPARHRAPRPARTRLVLGGAVALAAAALTAALAITLGSHPSARLAWPAPTPPPPPPLVTPIITPPPPAPIAPTPAPIATTSSAPPAPTSSAPTSSAPTPPAPSRAAVAPTPAPAPSRPRTRAPTPAQRDAHAAPSPLASPPGVPGDVDGDGIPDVR
jgi:serine/threonine protein kinase